MLEYIKIKLQNRREVIQKDSRVRIVLLIVDLILLLLGLFISPITGIIIGLIGILFNELFSPIVIHKIFFQTFDGEIKPTGKLKIKVIRAKSRETKK